MVLWSGIPTDHTTYGPCVVFITGIQKLAKLMLTLPRVTARQADGSFTLDVVVPDGVNGFKVGARCNAEMYWFNLELISHLFY